MDSLIHDFYIIDSLFVNSHHGDLSLKKYLKNKKYARIHDDVIHLIFETLKWIKSYNYKDETEKEGLYYDGISYIHNDQLNILSKIIGNWISLLKLAPKIIKINKSNNECEKLIIENELKEMKQLIDEAKKLGHLIIHLGI